ncbi:MAG: mechanosensitive ion channel domain-containing protein [Microthrixaceae bacterium]
MELNQWIWAAIALGSGLLFGEIAGRILRAWLTRAERRPTLRESAGAIGSFVFWASTAVGLVVAIALLDTEVLHDLEDQLVDDLPRFLLAFLLVIAGYALSVAVAATVGQSARKATGVRQRALERLLQIVIMVAAIAIALGQIGVDPTMLVILLAGLLGVPCLSLALLSGLGGREVASQLAAGRALRHQLRTGDRLRTGSIEGRIVALHPTTVEVEGVDGARMHVPNRQLLGEPFSTRA